MLDETVSHTREEYNMQAMLLRVTIIAIGMLLGIIVTRFLESRYKLLTKYIEVMSQKTKNLQRHGFILALVLVFAFSFISAMLVLPLLVE